MMQNNEYKVLKFDGRFKSKILRGEKTCTIRFDDASRVQEGDRIVLKDDNNMMFAMAEVKRKIVRSAEEIVGMGIDGHREYSQMDEFLREMNGYYGGRVNEDSSLYMIWFEVDDGF